MLTLNNLLLIVLASAAFAGAEAAAADEHFDPAFVQTLVVDDPPFGVFQERSAPWEGVRIERWRRDAPEVDWRVLWIDLCAPGLGFVVSDYYEGTDTASGAKTQIAPANTTVRFLEENSRAPRVELAVNTVAFHPFPAFRDTPVVLEEPVWSGKDRARDPEPGALMLGLSPGRANIGTSAEVRTAAPTVALGSFLGGGSMKAQGVAVRDGRLVPERGISAGRTLAGIRDDGRILILVLADGYNPGRSIGFTPEEASSVLIAAGATDAIFLDGGGSSTLVARGDDGAPLLLNRPAGLQKTPGTLRYVGAHLGFTGLKRTDEPLPAVTDWQAPLPVVVWMNVVVWWRVYPVRATIWIAAALVVLIAAGRLVWKRIRQRRRLQTSHASSEPDLHSPP